MLTEDVVPAVGAAIACAIFALGLVLRQMARHEKLLREILRVHEELLETLLPELRKASRAPAVRGSAAGKDSDSEPWHGDTRASAVPAPRAGSRVPRAAAPPTSAASSPSRADRGLAPAKARNGGSVPGAPTPHGLPAAALCTLWASAVTRLISDGVPPSPQRSPTLALARSWPPHPQDSRGAPVAPQTREASPIWPRQASRGAPVDPPIQPLNNTTRRSPANRVGLAPRNSPKSA